MFKRHWSDRLNSVSAVYNYPADPVYIEFAEIKSEFNRIRGNSQKNLKPQISQAVHLWMQQTALTRRSSRKMSFAAPIIEEEEINFSKVAFLFITCQNEFLDEAGKLYPKVETVMKKLGTKKNLCRLMEAASNTDALIIHAPVGIETSSKYTVFGLDENKLAAMSDVFTVGSWGAEFYKDTCASSDDVILRGRSTNDLTTDPRLMSSLVNRQIERIFVCGLLTDVTVEQTVVSLAKKFKGEMAIHPISDATASSTMDAQQITFKTVLSKHAKPLTTDEAIDLLQDSM